MKICENRVLPVFRTLWDNFIQVFACIDMFSTLLSLEVRLIETESENCKYPYVWL